ncbi:MAG: Modification methylase HpaII [Bacteroidota bacterium]|jgi:DNA (cytosine-5)-methyltransferase 1
MNFIEKISLKEINAENLRIGFVKSESTRDAVLTHYIHNHSVYKFYKKEAIEITKSILEVKYPEQTITRKVAEQALQAGIFNTSDVPFLPLTQSKFTFIDLFAGIGGFRLALQNLGGKCLFTSEWDKEAQKTYRANFGEVPFGDITKEEVKAYIPNHFDILCAGFPCQAFSIAGKRGGFEDTRGTLFFDVAEIIKNKQPKAFFLENVKGLRNHDKGKTLETILTVLREDLGYNVPEPQIVNAKNFGVPQNRERIYIVGFRKDIEKKYFSYPIPTDTTKTFTDVKEENVVPTKYYLSTQYLQTLKAHKARHEDKGNGFGYGIIPDNATANAIVVGGMGRERNLVIDDRITDFTPTTRIKGVVNREGIRKMTPREWARLQGFPDQFIIPVSDASAYKQFGNSVAVPAIQATAQQILINLGIDDNRK